MLAGISEHVMDQLAKIETFETIPEEDVFPASFCTSVSEHDSSHQDGRVC